MKEKKEIWKLIELLNEYERESCSIWHREICWNWLRIKESLKWPEISEMLIISKKFGFIEWLVENDKINKDLISRVLIRAYISPENLVSLECEFHDYYESLLMLLSISNSPIEDLISYLR